MLILTWQILKVNLQLMDDLNHFIWIFKVLSNYVDYVVNHFIDSNAPTWANNLDGQINLRDAIRRTITFTNPENNKKYALRKDGKSATLIVR